MKYILASRNTHKIAEIAEILADTGVELLGLDAFPDLPQEIPETGDSFVANAIQKARLVYRATGLPTVADDSGIEVVALGQAPGIHSKRFTPQATAESNNARMLRDMAGVSDRRARFRCVVALVTDDTELTVEGQVTGTIGDAPRGRGGFGYDPLFWPDESPGRTMAELSADQKNAISHRGRAFRALAERIS